MTYEWEQSCPGADEYLEKLKSQKEGHLSIDAYSPTPSRVLIWEGRKRNWYSLSMTLGNIPSPGLNMWAAAWYDTPSLRKCLTIQRRVSIPTTQGIFQETVDGLLKEVSSGSRLLNLKGRHRKLQVVNLQTPSPHLTPYLQRYP